MAILENLVEGFAGAAGDEGTVNRIEQRKGERKAQSDEERKRQRDAYMATGHDIQKHLALLINPDTMKPMTGREAQVADLRNKLNIVNGHLEKFSNPDFNPQTGMVSKDPIRKLTDK